MSQEYTKPEVEHRATIYSNYDHELDKEVEKFLLEENAFARHSAWEFNACVWYDKARNEWFSEVWRYGSNKGVLRGTTAMDVINEANLKWGRE